MSILNERGGAPPKFNEDVFYFKWVGFPYLTDDVGIELLREVLEAGEAYWVDLGKRVARASRDRVISLSQQGIFEDLLNIRQVYLRQPTSLLDGFRDGGYGPDPLPYTHEYMCMIRQMRAAGITSSDSRDSSGPSRPRPAIEDGPSKGSKASSDYGKSSKYGSDKYGSDKYGGGKSGSGKYGSDKYSSGGGKDYGGGSGYSLY